MTVHQLRRDAWGLGADRPEAALALLQVAHRREPSDPDLLWQKALFEHAAGDLVTAEHTLKQLLGLASRDVEAMGLLARVLRRLGRLEEAAGWERRRTRADG
jgi:Flp pilus assembly protein TadD